MSDFYPSVTFERGKKSIAKAIERGQITQDDATLIKSYISEYRAVRHIREHRALKTTYDLVNWRRFIRLPYRSCTAPDIFDGVGAMVSGTSLNGHPFKQNTKHDYVKALRAFLIWMVRAGHSRIPESEVLKIKVPPRDFDTTPAKDLLTKEEVLAMINATTSSRNRAIIATHYEVGTRIGEISLMTWSDLVFDDYGVQVIVHDTKTLKLRYARCTMATPYLAAWRLDYPGEASGDAKVFISERGTPMKYQNLEKIIKTAAKAAGIQKEVTSHLIRKTRITHTVKEGYPESVLKKVFWGNVETRQFRTYVRLSEQDIDDAFLTRAGIIQKDRPADDTLKARTCYRCKVINIPTARTCRDCGHPLTEEAMTARELIRDAIRKDPLGYLEMVREMVIESSKKDPSILSK
jgi:site-specific recombinase XerD